VADPPYYPMVRVLQALSGLAYQVRDSLVVREYSAHAHMVVVAVAGIRLVVPESVLLPVMGAMDHPEIARFLLKPMLE
jgi:hypothetical protein